MRIRRSDEHRKRVNPFIFKSGPNPITIPPRFAFRKCNVLCGFPPGLERQRQRPTAEARNSRIIMRSSVIREVSSFRSIVKRLPRALRQGPPGHSGGPKRNRARNRGLSTTVNEFGQLNQRSRSEMSVMGVDRSVGGDYAARGIRPFAAAWTGASGSRSDRSSPAERTAKWSSTSRRYDHGLSRCRIAL